MNDIQNEIDNIYRVWYKGIDKNNNKEGWGALCGGITILENLMGDYILNLAHHQTRSGTQLKNAGEALGRKILKRFGITLKVRLGEFGRTSRGGPPAAGRLMQMLESLHLEALSLDERNKLLLFLQELMVRDLLTLMERNTQLIETTSTTTLEKMISDVLVNVPKIASGAVAQHLVGAKLTLRFPELVITNDVTAAADAPTNRPGDFLIEDAALHITLSPQNAVFEKCIQNLNEGYIVYLLVSEKSLETAKRKAENYGIKDQIVIKSIESFISQNIDEIAQFSKEKLDIEKRALIQTYNNRIQLANERYAPFLVYSSNDSEINFEQKTKEGLENHKQNAYQIKNLFDGL